MLLSSKIINYLVTKCCLKVTSQICLIWSKLNYINLLVKASKGRHYKVTYTCNIVSKGQKECGYGGNKAAGRSSSLNFSGSLVVKEGPLRRD